MQLKKEEKWLLVIFFCLLAFRLFFALKTGTFLDDVSYFNLRQILQISKTGLPILKGDLSYSGGNIIFLPEMHYISAAVYLIFGKFVPIDILFKVFMNVCASAIVIVVYLACLYMSRDRKASLLAALAAGFSPIFISETVNRISTFSISIPMNFLMFYFFMRSGTERSFVKYFLITLIFCAFLDSTIFIFLIAMVFYLLLIEIEELKESVARYELIFFSIIFVSLLNFLVFKNALLVHGLGIIWRNLPAEVIARYFQRMNIIDIIYKVNVIPFLTGIYVLYIFAVREKRKNILLLAAICFTVLALLWLRLIEFNAGLILLGIVFALLFGYFYKTFFLYIEKTKIVSLKKFLSIALLSLLIIISLIHSYAYAKESVQNSVSKEELNALSFLKEKLLNESSDSTVVSAPSSGYIISYFTQTRNVIDTNFLQIEHVNERYDDVKQVYTTPYETTAIKLLEKYNVDFIYFSGREKNEFNVEELKYVNDEKCFKLIYNNNIKIYQSLCRLKQVY